MLAGVITSDTALTYATNKNNLSLSLSDSTRGESSADDGLIPLASSDDMELVR